MTDWQTILAIDAEKWAAETYRANFPGVRVECAPVADWLDRLPGADVLLGGPPCPPFSLAGKRLGQQDPRNRIPDFVSAVQAVRPRMFLMEQVPGILSADHIGYFGRVLLELEASGYVVEYRALDAVNYGVPQFRNRVWTWGIRNELHRHGTRHRWPNPSHAWPPPQAGLGLFGVGGLLPGVTVGQALGLRGEFTTGSKCRRGHDGVPRGPIVKSTDNPAFTIDSTPGNLRVLGGGYNPPAGRPDLRTVRDIADEPSTTIPTGGGNAIPELVLTGPQTADMPCFTICAGGHMTGGPEPIPNRIAKGFSRRLLPQECFRLQSGPDCFVWPEKIGKGAKYVVTGNGWASLMAQRMAEAFRATDPTSRTVIDLFCGGGLGAVGWHGRAWHYEPVDVAAA